MIYLPTLLRRFAVGEPFVNLVLYNRYNNNLNDETGNHVVVGSGIDYVNGLWTNQTAQAVRINTADDIQIAVAPLLSPGNEPWTFSTGVYVENVRTQTNYIINKGSLSASNLDREYRIWVVPDGGAVTGRIRVQLFDQSTGGYLQATTDASINEDTAYHLVVRHTGSTDPNDIEIFVNSVKWATTVTTVGTYIGMENLSGPVVIGNQHWSTSNSTGVLLGRLDGLGWWDGWMPDEQIVAIYQKQVIQKQELL